MDRKFSYQQQHIRLNGLPDVQGQDLQAVSVEGLVKCFKGNDIWQWQS
jgi:hypothetical protein